ncbi:ECF-type sigma factor [Arenibaculum pallidiluteum]|uniref:ECF-type sigma factor n=1 Tax=Arenibaculum pallidiluteum TaxID=2812559 RepID=UPI001A965FA1|nr:ECF-type sigma factor [Arenibaculum pallidiluteum]
MREAKAETGDPAEGPAGDSTEDLSEDLSEDAGGRDLARAVAALSGGDLLRLQALARLRARGLPGVEWADILHEAVLRALSGAREWPHDVSLLAFLAGVMRSIADEHARRARRERRAGSGGGALDEAELLADESPGADPERLVAGAQALASLRGLFAGDPVALRIVAGLAEGLSAAEIRARHALGETEYDTARRRMRRILLRRDGGGGDP